MPRRYVARNLILRVGLGYDYWLDRLLQRTGNPRLMRGGDAYIDDPQAFLFSKCAARTCRTKVGIHTGWRTPTIGSTRRMRSSLAPASRRGSLCPARRARPHPRKSRKLSSGPQQEAAIWIDRFAPFAGVKLIAYHNSWPYFARRFRLEIVDFIEPKPGLLQASRTLAPSCAKRGRKACRRSFTSPMSQPRPRAISLSGAVSHSSCSRDSARSRLAHRAREGSPARLRPRFATMAPRCAMLGATPGLGSMKMTSKLKRRAKYGHEL